MAKKIDLGGNYVNEPEINECIGEVFTAPSQSDDKGIKGLSEAELNDPNNIKVTISDPNTPIVVLFGPAECGKTMTLVRLTRYLQKYGYRVSPIRSFRPSRDTHYTAMCDGFNEMVNSPNAAEGTEHISFMLVGVLDKNGRSICQILEAPGELYFKPEEPNKEFPTYVHEILNCSNRKIWIYMVEPNWKDSSDRANYVERIKTLKNGMKPQDKAIFLYNKVDKTPYVLHPGKVNLPLVKNDISNMYPGIFVPFLNQNPVTQLFRKYNCSLVPFSNGAFTKGTTSEGEIIQKYIQGVDEYPGMLWNTIVKLVKG